MARTQKKITAQEQATEDFIKVHRQALVDKQDVLEAIDSRMARTGIDHDLLISINTMMTDHIEDIKKLNAAIFGPDGTDGIAGWVNELRTKFVYILLVGGGIISVLAWLVVLHVKI
jgi:hypothetical protein